ncbi:hypothetical protein V5O48_018243 [Marasmius crinis-equi]|uniref:Alpha/beta hydrolase fold-3 domain-containing protein n=1 Tax=Marasmius crinis-equi TaxID=585013 RepID=A0ABR3ELV1_9AGAR
MPETPKARKFGYLTWIQWLRYKVRVGLFPLYIAWKVVSSPLVKHNRNRTLQEVITHANYRYICVHLDPPEVQYHAAPCVPMYTEWMKKRGMPPVVEELEGDTTIVWLGPKRTEKVILYCHGGAYFMPLLPVMLTYWRYVQVQLEKRGIEVGVACLVYTLIPDGVFPNQLRQATIAINHLLASGVETKNLQITGDSAGGNLVLQVLSHALHPHPQVPPLRTNHFRGAYAMSAWVLLATDREHDGGESLIRGDRADIMSKSCLKVWGDAVMKGVPAYHGMYAEPIKAPHGWYAKVGEVVDRILITTGEYDCFEDQDREIYETLRKYTENVEFIDQEAGVHDGPYLEFGMGDSDDVALPPSSITPAIIEWFAKGFQTAN